MKLAIIGCGSIGMRHLKNALSLGCEVRVFDYDDAKLDAAATLGATRYGVWADDIDAMMVCTPWDTHLDIAQHNYVRPCPLFIEKPLGALDQIEDWRRLVEASESLVTQVGYQCRFHAKARAMKLLFPDAPKGRFGCHCDMSTWPGKSYGPLLLEASHEIDLALSFGAPARVQSVEQTSPLGSHIVFDEQWDSWLSNSPGYYSRTWIVEDYDDHGVEVSFDSPEALGDQMYVDELKHFLECVQTGRQTDVPLKDGLRVLEVCAQIEAMARQHA